MTNEDFKDRVSSVCAAVVVTAIILSMWGLGFGKLCEWAF